MMRTSRYGGSTQRVLKYLPRLLDSLVDGFIINKVGRFDMKLYLTGQDLVVKSLAISTFTFTSVAVASSVNLSSERFDIKFEREKRRLISFDICHAIAPA